MIPSDPWPRCPDCDGLYVVTLGLPVVISASPSPLVELAVDTADLDALDDASLSCNCGTLDDAAAFDAVCDALAPWLVEIRAAAQKVSGVVVNLRHAS